MFWTNSAANVIYVYIHCIQICKDFGPVTMVPNTLYESQMAFSHDIFCFRWDVLWFYGSDGLEIILPGLLLTHDFLTGFELD